jgi:hypothetical protein
MTTRRDFLKEIGSGLVVLLAPRIRTFAPLDTNAHNARGDVLVTRDVRRLPLAALPPALQQADGMRVDRRAPRRTDDRGSHESGHSSRLRGVSVDVTRRT